MPPKTSSQSADQPPPDEIVADLGSLPSWPKHLDAKRYEVLVVATRVPKKWDPANQEWVRKLSWTLAPYTKVVVDEKRRHDRGYVLLLADAFLFKSLAQDLPVLTSASVADPKFKAGFDKFVAMYNASVVLKRLEQSEQRARLTAGLAALRENAAAASAAWTQGRERAAVVTGFAAWKQAARKQAAWKQALAVVSARWTQGRERANAAAGFAAWREKAIAAAEAKAATAACDAEALANGLVGLGLETPARLNSKSRASALERVRTPQAVNSLANEVSSRLYFQSSDFKVRPLVAEFPWLAVTSAGDNECMTVPAAADFVNGVPPAHVRSLSTFGLGGISCVATPVNENGAGLLYNPDGELASPFLIGIPMSASIDRWIVPNGLDRWANTPFYKRRDALRREEQCPARIQTPL